MCTSSLNCAEVQPQSHQRRSYSWPSGSHSHTVLIPQGDSLGYLVLPRVLVRHHHPSATVSSLVVMVIHKHKSVPWLHHSPAISSDSLEVGPRIHTAASGAVRAVVEVIHGIWGIWEWTQVGVVWTTAYSDPRAPHPGHMVDHGIHRDPGTAGNHEITR